MNEKKLRKEPLVRISKREEIDQKRAWAYRVAAIFAALIVNAIIIATVIHMNPFEVYGSIWEGAFGTSRKILVTLKETSLLLLVAVALTPAFKMKFWNLGGEGQILMGAWISALMMIKLGDVLPSALLIVMMMASALVVGGIWAVIPAICKAKWGTNETLFTLMMNYVATQLVAFCIILWEVPKGSGHVGIINQNTKVGWMPMFQGNSYIIIVILALLITAGMYVYLKFSKHGYEITVVGESQRTASYVGIKVNKVIIRTLVLSGAICGFVGWMLVSACDHTITTTLSGGMGFTAIMVSWLAQFNIPVMFLASLLIVFMGQGAGEVATSCGLNAAFGDILTGIIIFFIIGIEFAVNYKVDFRKKEKEVA